MELQRVRPAAGGAEGEGPGRAGGGEACAVAMGSPAWWRRALWGGSGEPRVGARPTRTSQAVRANLGWSLTLCCFLLAAS